MVCADVHWSAPPTRELLDPLIDRVPTLRVLVVITFRPEFAAGSAVRARPSSTSTGCQLATRCHSDTGWHRSYTVTSASCSQHTGSPPGGGVGQRVTASNHRKFEIDIFAIGLSGSACFYFAAIPLTYWFQREQSLTMREV
jgi:hypothetical protein